MNNNEYDNQATGVYDVVNPNTTSTPNNSLNDQIFTDDSLNNFGQTSTENTTSDLSNQSLQSESVDTIFNDAPVSETITPSVSQPVNNVSQNLNNSTPVSNIVEEPINPEPKKKKKSKGPVIFIIFLVIIALGLAGYIVYDKYLSKDNADSKDTEEKETNTLTKVKDTALIEELRNGLIAESNGIVEGLYHNTKITSFDVSNKSLLKFNILKYIVDNNINVETTKSTIDTGVQQDVKAVIPKADITTYMQNKYNTDLNYVFNGSKQYDRFDIIGYMDILVDDSNYYYVTIPGGDGSYHLSTKLVKAEEDKNYVYIYDKAIYSIFGLGGSKSFDSLDTKDYYNEETHEYIADKVLLECQPDNTTVDPEDMIKSDKCPFSGTMSSVTPEKVSEYIFSNMSDKLKTFKHTFKKLDGNYFWVSTEVVK